MDDRFEIGRDLGIAIIHAISDFKEACEATMGDVPTTFEVVGVLHALASDYCHHMRLSAQDEDDD